MKVVLLCPERSKLQSWLVITLIPVTNPPAGEGGLFLLCVGQLRPHKSLVVTKAPHKLQQQEEAFSE